MKMVPAGRFKKQMAAMFALAVTVRLIRDETNGRGGIQVTKSTSQSMAARQLLSCRCGGTGSILSAGDLHEEGGDGGGGDGCVRACV